MLFITHQKREGCLVHLAFNGNSASRSTPAVCDLQTCPGFRWDRINFLPNNWHGAVFWF